MSITGRDTQNAIEEAFFLAEVGVSYCRIKGVWSSSQSFSGPDAEEVEGADLAARSLPCSGLKCAINLASLSMMTGRVTQNAINFTFALAEAFHDEVFVLIEAGSDAS